MKLSHYGALLVAAAFLLPVHASAADIEAGKAKSAVCAACHGADGNSANPIWPSLAGQHASYTYKQLTDFKAGNRVNASMAGMVAILNDDDMKNLAAYYESLESKPVAFDAEMIDAGENIYRGGITETGVAACIGCHSPSGQGNGPAGWPSLTNQHPEYIVAQLKAFQAGERANDSNEMMRALVKRMSEKEMMAVAAYIAGIR